MVSHNVDSAINIHLDHRTRWQNSYFTHYEISKYISFFSFSLRHLNIQINYDKDDLYYLLTKCISNIALAWILCSCMILILFRTNVTVFDFYIVTYKVYETVNIILSFYLKWCYHLSDKCFFTS